MNDIPKGYKQTGVGVIPENWEVRIFADIATACPDSLVAITPNNQVDRQWLFHELKSRKKIFEGLATQNAQLILTLKN